MGCHLMQKANAMQHTPHIRIGDAVSVTHRLGTILATGTITKIWTERHLINHRPRDIAKATVEFPTGGKGDYPIEWLTRIIDEPTMDMPCPNCGAENSLNLRIDVVLKLSDGNDQLGSLTCKDCGVVAHPNVRTTIG